MRYSALIYFIMAPFDAPYGTDHAGRLTAAWRTDCVHWGSMWASNSKLGKLFGEKMSSFSLRFTSCEGASTRHSGALSLGPNSI